jgi:hypothetical protein
MPVPIRNASIAFVRLVSPRRVTAGFHRMLTNNAIARATARGVAFTASEQQRCSHPDPLRIGPNESSDAAQ